MPKYSFLFFCFLLISCTAKVDKIEQANKLLNTDIAFARMSVEKGAAEAFHFYLDDNALQLPEGKQPSSGKAKIYEMMKPRQADYVLDWQPKHAEVSKSGDLGYTWGTWTLFVKSDSTAKSFGKYLNIWKRQLDGEWRVLVDMGNENPEPGLSQ